MKEYLVWAGDRTETTVVEAESPTEAAMRWVRGRIIDADLREVGDVLPDGNGLYYGELPVITVVEAETGDRTTYLAYRYTLD